MVSNGCAYPSTGPTFVLQSLLPVPCRSSQDTKRANLEQKNIPLPDDQAGGQRKQAGKRAGKQGISSASWHASYLKVQKGLPDLIQGEVAQP